MKLTAALAALLSVAHAINSIDMTDSETFESLSGVPQGWQSVGAPDAASRMRFKIALRMVCTNLPIAMTAGATSHGDNAVGT
jgi:hypothetical protein